MNNGRGNVLDTPILDQYIREILNRKMTVRTAADYIGMSTVSIYDRLREIRKAECNNTTCAAIVKNTIDNCWCCMALVDTDFNGKRCPFFKTEKKKNNEYDWTNKKSPETLKEMRDEGYNV